MARIAVKLSGRSLISGGRAQPRLLDQRRDAAQLAARDDLLEAAGQTPAPVGVCVGGARQIRLLDLARSRPRAEPASDERASGRDKRGSRPRARSYRPARRLRGGIRGSARRQAALPGRAPRAADGDRGGARPPRVALPRRIGIEAETAAPGDIGAEPEPLQGRDVVGRRRGGGQRRVFVGRHEAAVPSPFEHEDPVRQYIGRPHRLAKPVRHGAEILADDGAALPPALERDEPQEIARTDSSHRRRLSPPSRSGSNRAGCSDMTWSIRRIPGVTHIGAQRRDERRKALTPQHQRIDRRQAPILPAAAQRVGRRADRCAGRDQLLVGPRFRAVADRRRPRDRGRARSTARPRGPRRAAAPSCRSASHCRNWKNSTRSRCAAAKSATSGERGLRIGAGQLCHENCRSVPSNDARAAPRTRQNRRAIGPPRAENRGTPCAALAARHRASSELKRRNSASSTDRLQRRDGAIIDQLGRRAAQRSPRTIAAINSRIASSSAKPGTAVTSM